MPYLYSFKNSPDFVGCVTVLIEDLKSLVVKLDTKPCIPLLPRGGGQGLSLTSVHQASLVDMILELQDLLDRMTL